MAKKVLFISYDGMTDPLGQSQVLPYLRGLSERGHRITIVSAEKRKSFKKNSGEIQKLVTAAGISWKPVFFSKNIPGLSALKNYLRLRKAAKDVVRDSKIEIIHGRSYIPSLIGLEMKKRFGTKLIFDMRGFWADERVEGKLWNLRNPLYNLAYRFFKSKETQLLKQSDAVVVLTESGKNEILAWNHVNVSMDKITTIRCCADLSFFSSQSIAKERVSERKKQLGIADDDFVLSYSGSLGTWYLLDEMLEFFRLLLKKRSNAKFLFITPEPAGKIMKAAREKKISDDKIIVTVAKRSEMPLLLSLSGISIFFIRNSFSKKASSPTKMGELMSLGIPVICNAGVGDVKKILEETGAGITVDNFSDRELHLAIDRLEQLLSIPGEKIRNGAAQFYSLEKGIEQYHRIYSSM